MNIAVLFDGAGLARLGLERSGHNCTGFELDPWKHYLSKFVGSGRSILADVTKIDDLDRFDAIWASPPCQFRSSARTQGMPKSEYSQDYLQWSLALPHEVLWVENIMSQSEKQNKWGIKWNAAQFLQNPIQCRNRIVGGTYPLPRVFREYKRFYPELDICPSILASEYKGCATDTKRASRWYGRRLTIEECAYHMGFTIPKQWMAIPQDWPLTEGKWRYNLYEAIGNGVPIYMAEEFGLAICK